MVDKKTFWIGILCLTAAMLLVANLMNPAPASADLVIKDLDYQLATAGNSAGGDSLFVTDNRTGMVAVQLSRTACAEMSRNRRLAVNVMTTWRAGSGP